MIAMGIIIPWDYSDEYIEVDLDALEEPIDVRSTLEWWRNEKAFVRYNTSCEIERLSGGVVQLSVHYNQNDNPHIDVDEYPWGRSVIHLTPGADSGEAKWIGSRDISNDGTVMWKRIFSGLLKEKKRETTSRFQRTQAAFRSALLTYGARCALTNEDTLDALEAAHIIPSKCGGAEVVQNGLLLRADLHRLYDAGKFSLDPSGQVVDIKEDLSPAYRSILNGVRIAPEAVQRTKQALLHQWNSASKGTGPLPLR